MKQNVIFGNFEELFIYSVENFVARLLLLSAMFLFLKARFEKTDRIIILLAAYRQAGGRRPVRCQLHNLRSLCPIITKFDQNVYWDNISDKYNN